MRRFNLDNYIQKNEKGYLKNKENGLFVDLGNDFIQPIGNAVDDGELIDITRDEFIQILMGSNK